MAGGGTVEGWVAEVAIVAVPLLAAIVVHEVAHGWVAYQLGDPTAARQGRLTLNPLPHIDPFGTVILPGLLLLAPLLLGTPAFVFGYARPVPVDIRRLRRPRRDAVLVALAGPATNLAMATLGAFALAWLPVAGDPTSLLSGLRHMAAAALSINCLLAVFNLLPVPPLDGGRVMTALLPVRPARALQRLEGIGTLLVLLVVMNSNVLARLVRPLMVFLLRLTH